MIWVLECWCSIPVFCLDPVLNAPETFWTDSVPATCARVELVHVRSAAYVIMGRATRMHTYTYCMTTLCLPWQCSYKSRRDNGCYWFIYEQTGLWVSCLIARRIPTYMSHGSGLAPCLGMPRGFTICQLCCFVAPQATDMQYALWSLFWRGGFMMFLFGTLCYAICTMKPPP